ncbi:MAG TPA: 4Fe-4S binding protein [Nitrososphaerales archaeon]|nr:4Fe-4S binding protein [Nitrososphaerales archaeon]
MKVCLEIGTGAEAFLDLLSAEVEKSWAPGVSVISSEDEVPRGVEGILAVGPGAKPRSAEGLLVVDSIDTSRLGQDQILFQTSAKLGRMVSSDLVKTKSRAPSGPSQGMSRRDLLFGFRGATRGYTDAPAVFDSICDSKYGCTKCVDTCPSDALAIAGGSVAVDEAKCTRCGECAAVCPTSAIQLPRFSEEAFLGLLEGLKKSGAPAKALVLTCDASKLDPLPWTFVEQVKDVGAMGPRQLALAASSGLAAVVVYCSDGRCVGAESAKAAAASVSLLLEPQRELTVEFAQGGDGAARIKEIRARLDKQLVPRISPKERRLSYTTALVSLARPGAPAEGLGLTDLKVSDTCTLCGTCVKSCPHVAIAMTPERLIFDSSWCTGCGYCAQLCPEKSITLVPLKMLSGLGKRTVFSDVVVNCARCGQPIGSAGLLRRVTALVGKEDPMMKYCQSCKQIVALESVTKLGTPGRSAETSPVASDSDDAKR